jgi:beta-galactosidase
MAKFWQDPRALAINRRQSHTPLKSYVAPDAAVRQLALPTQGYAPAGSREQLLSGCDWRFKLFDSPEAVPASFHEPGYADDGFTTVRSISSTDSSSIALACSLGAVVNSLIHKASADAALRRLLIHT